ncbi:hypothetical protein [Rhizobium leguminosarum]|uniref:hypothetical protein n=1 Tax=Rhizobium leguminosarum TaxID=384 RepID=UPI001AE71119|nr:hypothetical protein [Rhizobium leguminosarum]MBP2449908.1 hypothetical protein [Rhizobium leguminosarum]
MWWTDAALEDFARSAVYSSEPGESLVPAPARRYDPIHFRSVLSQAYGGFCNHVDHGIDLCGNVALTFGAVFNVMSLNMPNDVTTHRYKSHWASSRCLQPNG